MDRTEHESLALIEYLMEEFFNPTTTNLRKHEIELQLNAFKSTPELWKLCLYFLTNTSSQYVTMFALSTLESVINQHWSSTYWSLKDELKTILNSYLIEKGSTAPYFIRGKYSKLLIDIAKQDWPHNYPNFFDNIIELLKSEPNQLIGLILLRTTSEEFMGIQAQFDNGRKDEITRLMNQYIPIVFQLLNDILDNLAARRKHRVTATPPPSPTHPTQTPNLSQQLATATFRPDTKALNKEILNTIQHLFTWVQINQIPPTIIKEIFNFTNISSYAQDDDDICILAITTINELLYRKYNLLGSQEFFTQIYYHVIELLRDIVCSSTYRIDTLEIGFVEKLTELLILLIEQHFCQFQLDPQFSAFEFLSLLYTLTMQLHSVQGYLQCLNVWNAFIKQNKAENIRRYSEIFSGLINDLLKKIQFSYNVEQLKEINNAELNDDNETEWDIFLKNSIDIISLVAEFAPLEIFDKIFNLWKSSFDLYRSLENYIDFQNSLLNCELSERERLFFILKDFSTLTQTLTTLSSLFFHQSDEIKLTSIPILNTVIDRLISSVSFSTSMKFFNLKLENTNLIECFIDVYSEQLSALKTFIIHTPQDNKLSNDKLQILIDISLPIIYEVDKIPLKINHSMVQLLLALTSQSYTPNLINSPIIIRFIQMAPTIKFTNNQTNYLLNSIIINLLLKYWGQNNETENLECNQQQRQYLIEFYFNLLTRDFRQLTIIITNQQRAKEIVENTLPILSYIIDFSRDFPIVSKKILYCALKETIDHALSLFPSYVKYPEISNNILILFLNVLRVLQQQLGIENTKYAVEVFLEVAITERANLFNLEKLLQILQFVVESPGSFYKNFLPGILQLSVEHVHPFVLSQAHDSPDVFLALLTLLYSILLHRWQYFWPSTRINNCGVVTSTSNSNTTNRETNSTILQQRNNQFLAVLEIFGEGLTQSDLNIFRLSLTALENLNTKWHLYEKLFGFTLLERFLTVLLQTLTDKSHTLLSEDIQIAIYNIAAINFDGFTTTFLYHFIENLKGITPTQQETLLRNFVQNHDTDMPTFVRHLQKFVNDIQHFRRCNMPAEVFVS